MRKYNISFRLINAYREDCKRKKEILKSSQSYSTLINVYDTIESLKCAKASDYHIVKSIHLWIQAYKRVNRKFVAYMLNRFLDSCEVDTQEKINKRRVRKHEQRKAYRNYQV